MELKCLPKDSGNTRFFRFVKSFYLSMLNLQNLVPLLCKYTGLILRKILRICPNVTATRILPVTIQISVSDVCNFKCTSCCIHGPTVEADANNFEALLFRDSAPQLMDVNSYERLILAIKKNLLPVSVSFCGKGEPTLHPRFLQMVEFASKNGISSHITTNGSGLTVDMLQALRKLKVSLNISLNAYNQTSHQAFSNTRKDFFTPLIEMIRSFNNANHRGFISLSFVIGAHNIGNIEAMAQLSADILPAGSSIYFYPEWTHHGNPENKVSTAQIEALLNKLQKVSKLLLDANIKNNLEFLPHILFGVSVSEESEEPTREYYMKNPCTTVDEFMVVLADGRVVPCCRSSYVYGNAFEQSIFDVWAGSEAIKFRQLANNIFNIKKEAPNSHCYSCDHIMGNKFFIHRYRNSIARLKNLNNNRA